MNVVDISVAIAEKVHAGQFRRDGKTPYITHPMRVMRWVETLWEEGEPSNDALLAAAVLHDTVEDTKGDPNALIVQIHQQCGSVVSGLVWQLTKPRLPAYSRKIYQASLAQAGSSVRLIKAADIVDNLDDTDPSVDLEFAVMFADRGEKYAGIMAVGFLEFVVRKAVDALRGRIDTFLENQQKEK